MQLAILEQIEADMRGMRDDAFVQASRRTLGACRCKRTEREAAARCIVARFGGPGARRTIAVELHRDAAVTVKPHGVKGVIVRALRPERVIHGPKLEQAPVCAAQRRLQLGLCR
jgi:hypothetical protein